MSPAVCDPSFCCCFSCLIQGFRVDLSCKQLTVDFVNQSVLQISGQDVESKRSDKTDFAERLGDMNRRWQILQGRINERVKTRAMPPVLLYPNKFRLWRINVVLCVHFSQIQFLESLLEMWFEYESSIQALKSWMAAQEERLKRKHRIEDLTSVQNALKDCQVAEQTLIELRCYSCEGLLSHLSHKIDSL